MSQILYLFLSFLDSLLCVCEHKSQMEEPHFLQWCLGFLIMLNISSQSLQDSFFSWRIDSGSKISGRCSSASSKNIRLQSTSSSIFSLYLLVPLSLLLLIALDSFYLLSHSIGVWFSSFYYYSYTKSSKFSIQPSYSSIVLLIYIIFLYFFKIL